MHDLLVWQHWVQVPLKSILFVHSLPLKKKGFICSTFHFCPSTHMYMYLLTFTLPTQRYQLSNCGFWDICFLKTCMVMIWWTLHALTLVTDHRHHIHVRCTRPEVVCVTHSYNFYCEVIADIQHDHNTSFRLQSNPYSLFYLLNYNYSLPLGNTCFVII